MTQKKYEHQQKMPQRAIDFVLLWVDGNDPAWLEEKSKYLPSEDSESNLNNSRYRDWGVLPFWFRSVERYAPWVRKIHFVTWGHYPQWLNLDHPKLNYVRHEDFIPFRYLPTFSSRPIENNLHRIPDLTEQFVYFNDDMFISSPVKPTDFFIDGVPRDCAIRNIPMLYEIGHNNLNDINLINKAFDFKKQYKKHFWKWMNYRYGIRCLQNLVFTPFIEFTGAKNTHVANAYSKTTFYEVWDKFESILDQTCQHKFRSVLDVNQWLFKYWQIVSGNFVPQWINFGKATNIGDLRTIKKAFVGHKYKLLCLQDCDWMSNIEPLKAEVHQLLESVFPQKSSFEL